MSLSLNEKLCHAQHSQLLIIDIQERLASAMPAEILERVIQNNRILLTAANELDVPVIHSEQYPKGLGHTVSELSELFEDVTDSNLPFTKTCFACTEEDGFNELISKRNRQQIIISGIESHICVLQTALQLQRQGYAVYVVEDAICSRKKLNHKNAIARLRQNGIIVSNVESVLFEWLRDAKHASFKKLSTLIK